MKLIHSLTLLLCASFLPIIHTANAQNLFTNGGLEGTISMGLAGNINSPNGWSMVPYGSPICEAYGIGGQPETATPDITGVTGQNPSIGIAGNPHGGNTFISGLYYGEYYEAGQNWFVFHEGIQQSVVLEKDKTYQLDLWQSVVRQKTILGTTGQWKVYLDNDLLWTTDTTTSNLGWDKTIAANLNLDWEQRSNTFSVNETKSYTISFLPYTPGGKTTEANGVRMGIDDISLTVAPIPEPSQTMFFGSLAILTLLKRKRKAL